jgi:hypothetical protein
MTVLPQTLSRAISSSEAGVRPGFVLGLALLQGTQLSDKLVFDRSAGALFDDPAIGFKLHGSVHGMLDLLNDTFHGTENCVGMQFDNFSLIASRLGDYTLVAVNRAGSNYQVGTTWLQGLTRVLLAGV